MVDCVHAIECAGCPLIEHDYVQQLASKRQRVVSAVAHYPTLELVFTRTVEPADPIVGYRGRAKLIVSPAGAIGLYGRGADHEVVDIPECRVLTPALSEIAQVIRKLILAPPPAARALLLPYDPVGGGVLRALDLREVHLPVRPVDAPVSERTPTSLRLLEERVGVLVTLVLQRDRASSRDELREAAHALRPMLPRAVGLAVNFHDADTPQILGPETAPLDGLVQAEDRIGPVFHVASFGSFVQAHRQQASRVHAMIVREVASLDLDAPPSNRTASGRRTTPPRVLDLYGGSGAISLALAHARNSVTMVESFGPAALNARVAAQAQGLDNLEVRTGDVADVVAHLLEQREAFDAIVMNPPRRGVSPSAREAIARVGAPLCIYVSCDPDTLSRDLDHFARLGYGTSELMPLDMIPLTEEIETVSVLRRVPPPAPLVIYEDEDIVVVEKGPHEPVEAQPEYIGSLLIRCNRLPTAGELYPIHRLDSGTSGLCMLARSEEARDLWASALASTGRLIYLAAAKGVTPAKGAITRELREGGRSYPARTRYRRLAVASGHSVLRVIPDGGRTHQTRRHLAAIGHPVLGDERYGHMPTNRYFEEKHGLDRSFLHLVRIEIGNPRNGAKLLVESTLPGDLRATLERATGSSVLRFLEQKHALGDQRASSIPPPPLADDEPAPSSRISQLPGEEAPTSVPAITFNQERASAPDLDESPRTIRHQIVSDDED
jgi:23S rRNA (uracil1939-C5)-methyltransferase